MLLDESMLNLLTTRHEKRSRLFQFLISIFEFRYIFNIFCLLVYTRVHPSSILFWRQCKWHGCLWERCTDSDAKLYFVTRVSQISDRKRRRHCTFLPEHGADGQGSSNIRKPARRSVRLVGDSVLSFLYNKTLGTIKCRESEWCTCGAQT